MLLYAVAWIVVSLAIGAYYTRGLAVTDPTQAGWLGDRTAMLPGATTHGHYQIELDCNACHTPFGGVRQEACLDCHAAELKLAKDSHTPSKFDDPRNADLVAKFDAQTCITCHVEHQPHRTGPAGVTMAIDYCVHCHSTIGNERPTHAGLAFNSCATAGCHNYHDNTALYEDFLKKHRHDPPLLAEPRVPVRSGQSAVGTGQEQLPGEKTLVARDHDAPASVAVTPAVLHEWETTSHAKAGINCMDCHGVAPAGGGAKQWVQNPGYQSCASCHKDAVEGFLVGRHGMRLKQGLSPMSPEMARLPMKESAGHETLSCNSCHNAHRYDTRTAAVESCVKCHDDGHSRTFLASPHGRLWQQEMAGAAPPGSGVSCATCHMPRTLHKGDDPPRVSVQHNQNDNLRPNEKMARTACLSCHGLELTLDALADPALIGQNFDAPPAAHVPGLDWVRQRNPEKPKPASP